MTNAHIIHNGNLIPKENAAIPIDNIEWTYGFGVYENLKIRNSKIYFVDAHIDRLMQSAKIIGLEHQFNKDDIKQWIAELKEKNAAGAANVKILLIGGKKADGANLYIMTLAPRFPEKKIYTQGVHTITRSFERFLPQAKTLNMLPSYLFYREAMHANAHDTLLIDRDGRILEGTRSNFFAIKDKTIYTAPLERVLNGVTRQHVVAAAEQNGYAVTEMAVALRDIANYDGAFLTHTSGGIVPIRSVDDVMFAEVPMLLKELMKFYESYAENTIGFNS